MIGGTRSAVGCVLFFINPFNPSIFNQSSMMRSQIVDSESIQSLATMPANV
jgi:hypothetical protein